MPKCEKIKVPSINDTSKNSAAQTILSIPSDHFCELWCLLKSNGVIMVNTNVNGHITTFKLKEHIHKRGGLVHGEYLKDLVLLKVSDILESGSSIYICFIRLIYLLMPTVLQIFGNFKSLKMLSGQGEPWMLFHDLGVRRGSGPKVLKKNPIFSNIC